MKYMKYKPFLHPVFTVLLILMNNISDLLFRQATLFTLLGFIFFFRTIIRIVGDCVSGGWIHTGDLHTALVRRYERSYQVQTVFVCRAVATVTVQSIRPPF